MKRRSFLKKSSTIGIPLTLNGHALSVLKSSNYLNIFLEENDKVLVLVQLLGGNDGLNTIIPLNKYEILGRVRNNILIPKSQTLKITDEIGFHPSMIGLKNLYDNGNLTVVQDVGYPNQNRSHFRSLDIWRTGSPANEFWESGWLGRYFENGHSEFPKGYPNDQNPDPFAISMGHIINETCQGTHANFSEVVTDLQSVSELADGVTVDENLDSIYGRELAFLRTTIAQTNAYANAITKAADKGRNLSSLYGVSPLERQLKSIALLISGGLKTKVYVASLGGFDTHSAQVQEGEITNGVHSLLLNNMANAMNAFQDDLKRLDLENRVITMTFSEFGRRIASNDSLGTDHGSAAPLMIAGSCINSGFIGSTPELPSQPSFSDGVPMQFDFRNVYGSILIDWFGVDSGVVETLLLDEFNYIPIIKNCDTRTSINDIEFEKITSQIHPNPCSNWATIQFESKGDNYRISLLNGVGQEVQVVSSQYYNSGLAQIKVDLHKLPQGNYFYRIQSKSGHLTKGFIRI